MRLVVIVFIADLLVHALLDSVTSVHNIHHIVNCWETLKLILNHFLVFGFFAKYPLEERADVFYMLSVHFVALFRGKLPKADLVPRKVISRKGYCPFKFIHGHWCCKLVINWNLLQLWN